MKLRNIFTALAAAAFAFVGCQVEERFLDEIQVSQSIVALDVAGDQVEVTVNANDAWEIVGMPEWLTASPVSGAAGETVVTFSAEATTETREAVFYINVGEVQQVMNALQMAEKVETPLSTCKDVINGVDGKVYKIKGTVTSIVNTQYGNWYIQDDTGSVYVYGTLYNGATQQFTKLGLEVGDIVTIEGPRKDYNGTIEMVDVTVLDIEKSLIKLEKVLSTPLPLEGGSATALLTVKDGDFSVEIPEDASWLTAGEPYKIGDLTAVDLTAAPNEAGIRKATVTFKTTVDGRDYIAPTVVEQIGAIAEVTVAEFLAKEKGDALFKLTGKVSGLKTGDYGNFHLVDATGSVYVYGLTATPVEKNDKSFPTLGIREGDIVTLIGKRDRYDNAKVEEEKEQVGGPAYYVSHVGSTDVTVAEFLAKPVSNDVRYRLTGEITSLKTGNYGNFQLKDATGSVYVYGLTVAPVAKNDQSFPTLGLKEGDIVTLVGTRAQYASAKVEEEKEQVGGPAYYISHEAGAPAVDPWETAVSYSLPEGAEYQTLTNVKYYADATNVYVRLTGSSSKLIEAATDYVTIMIYDTVTGTAGNGFWGWWNNSIGNTEFAAEHCGVVAGTDLTLNIAGTEVAVEKTTDGDAFTWAFAIPRSVNSVLSGSEAYIGILAMKGWDATGAMPAKTDSMIKVTLP